MFKLRFAGLLCLFLSAFTPSKSWAWTVTWKTNWVCTVIFPTGATAATTSTFFDARECIDYYEQIKANNQANYPGSQFGLKIDNKQILPALAVAPKNKRCVVVGHDASIFTTTYPLASSKACYRFRVALMYSFRYDSAVYGDSIEDSNTFFLRDGYLGFSDFTVGAFWGNEVAKSN